MDHLVKRSHGTQAVQNMDHYHLHPENVLSKFSTKALISIKLLVIIFFQKSNY